MVRHVAATLIALLLGAATLHAQDVVFTVTSPSANVYKSPSTGGVVIGQAPRGRVFHVTRELGSWVRIAWPQADDGVGYLHVSWGTIARGDAAATAVRNASAPVAPPPAMPRPVPMAQSAAPRPISSRGVVSLPSHMIGIGGQTGSEAIGVAATLRAWSRGGALGVQIDASRSTRPALASCGGLQVCAPGSTTMQLAPSLLYSPSDYVSNAVWVRPYVGGGIAFARSTRDVLDPDAPAATTGMGYQAFGGAELTFAVVPQLSVSADLRRQWLPVPFEGTRAAQTGVAVSLHWYLR